jgi:hypothetical protein
MTTRGKYLPKGYAMEFAERALASQIDECIIWDGPLSSGGRYALLHADGKTGAMHRWICERAHGPIPGKLQVRHLCGNSRCQNPRHLTFGTAKQNAEDRDGHGTTARGQKGGRRHDLTEADVIEIRRLYDEGIGQTELARRFGSTQPNISFIVKRKTWTHI